MSYRKVPLKPAPEMGADPYAESSVQRRLWALRASKGIARIRFAAQLGVSGSTLDDWDRERSTPTLALFVRAMLLLDADVERTLFGLAGRAAAAAEIETPTVLDIASVRQWLEQRGESREVALAVLRAIRGRQKPATLEWLTATVTRMATTETDPNTARSSPNRSALGRAATAPPSLEAPDRARAKADSARRHLAARGGKLDPAKMRAAGDADARRRKRPARA